MPLINIVIPTCDRSETLYWSVKSCLEQSYDNYKIWVIDAGTDEKSFQVVKAFDDNKINYLKNPKKSSMTHNWEFAMEQIKEGYVMFIGDDDGLVYDSIKYLPELIEKSDGTAVKLFPVTYFWPDIDLVYNDFTGGKTCIYNENYSKIIDSKQILSQVNENLEIYPYSWLLPSIYHGLVNIEVINKIKNRDGKFFNSPVPDIYSSIIIAGKIETYLFSSLPICINGTSKFSTGLAFNSKHKKNKQAEKARESFSGDEILLCHNLLENEKSKLNMYPNTVIMAEAFLQANKRDSSIPSVNIEKLIKRAISFDLYNSTSREQYNSILESVMKIAEINNLKSFAEELLKNKETIKIIPNQEFTSDKFFVVNSEKLTNVYEASLFVSKNIVQKDRVYKEEKEEKTSSDYYNLAVNLMNKEKYHDSINFLTNLIQQNTLNYEICNLMGICLEKTGNENIAKLYYEKARKFINNFSDNS